MVAALLMVLSFAADAAWTDSAGNEHRPLCVEHGKANVLVFVLSDCPIANRYVPEINRLHEEFSSKGVKFFVVLVDRDISRDEAARHATDFGYQSPVLVDKSHELVTQWKVEKAPTAIVLTGGDRARYHGRIDDRWVRLGKSLPEPTKRDLRNALSSILENKHVEPDRTEVIGCHIPPLKEKK